MMDTKNGEAFHEQGHDDIIISYHPEYFYIHFQYTLYGYFS
jgi:hypothetical protein